MANNPAFLLGILSLFHIVGAIALGVAARGIWRVIDKDQGSVFDYVFFAILGGLFGCVPLAFGLQPQNPLWVLWGQLAVLVITFLVASFFGRRILRWLRPLFSFNAAIILVGVIFIAGGVYGGYIAFNEGSNFVTSLIIGGVFGLIGIGIALLGLINLFRNLSS